MEDENKVGEPTIPAEGEPKTPGEEETATEENADESIDWKAEALKQKEIAQNQKIRAEKAEKGNKKPPTAPSVTSTKDLLALMEAKVSDEDIEEVEDYAKYKGISISEALKSSTVKTLLAERREKRDVANATNTGSARRSPSKQSDDVLISKASKGEMPESSEDIARLIRARKGIK
jgi:hypothetical protein